MHPGTHPSLSFAPDSLRMISGPGCRSSPSDTSRMSLLAHLELVRRSRQRCTGVLKSAGRGGEWRGGEGQAGGQGEAKVRPR